MQRIQIIALNTFREAVRDRVLYNLIVFALLLMGTAIVFAEISIGIQVLILVNLGLTAINTIKAMSCDCAATIGAIIPPSLSPIRPICAALISMRVFR